MYFATIIIALFVLPLLAYSSDPTPTQPEVRGYDEWQHQHPKCNDLITRDHITCKCLPQYQEPTSASSHYGKRSEVEERKGGEEQLEECVCPDYPNTELDDGWDYGHYKRGGKGGSGGDDDHPKCICKGDHQTYNPKTRKCECDDGYQPSTSGGHYKRGGKGHGQHHLVCKPGPTGSAIPARKRSPSLHQAIKMREQDDRALERFLGCDSGENACETEGTWSCFNVKSLLWSCGARPGQGIDCGAAPGISEVKCHQGKCLIETCRRGFTLTDIADSEYGTNTTCVSVNRKSSSVPWFVAQEV
ncbi:uncharacterized protein IL334_005939 [Kwoniella shivajii]|uniref:Protein CPL1-like domain-containing protein n=1 Tax=Kwoniella shivajii TaxID=564305 RepID=A0ABZ1D5T3_9TREE|nr:hypothetical protein IL334_005939 [Kwoniella shivajii]